MAAAANVAASFGGMIPANFAKPSELLRGERLVLRCNLNLKVRDLLAPVYG